MDGNDLGMIARVFMFLLKGLKYVLKLVWDDCSITKPKPKHAASLTLH